MKHRTHRGRSNERRRLRQRERRIRIDMVWLTNQNIREHSLFDVLIREQINIDEWIGILPNLEEHIYADGEVLRDKFHRGTLQFMVEGRATEPPLEDRIAYAWGLE